MVRDDCCSSEYFYFKTDNFDLSGNNRINLVFLAYMLQKFKAYQNHNYYRAKFLIYQISNNLPPPEYGIELTVFHPPA